MKPLYTWETNEFRYKAFVTTRRDAHNEGNVGLHVGDDAEAVIANREAFFKEETLPFERSVWAEQVHGTHVHEVTEADIGKGAYAYRDAIPETDGLTTTVSDVPLALVFADCVPLLFCAPESGVIGVAHAGWKGTVGDIVGQMTEMFAAKGVAPEAIDMIIGPAITQSHYEVDRRVLDAVAQVSPEAYESAVEREQEGHALLSLQAVNAWLASSRHVNVIESNLCTVTHQSEFFSYRNGDEKRRFAAVIVKERKL